MNLKLYTKNLTSLSALREEKRRLKEQADVTAGSIFNDGRKTSGQENEEHSFDVSDAISAGMDVLTSKGAMSKILALGLPLLDLAEIKLEKKLIKTVGKEVLGGYIKWKAIEIGMNALSSYLKKKKD